MTPSDPAAVSGKPPGAAFAAGKRICAEHTAAGAVVTLMVYGEFLGTVEGVIWIWTGTSANAGMTMHPRSRYTPIKAYRK